MRLQGWVCLCVCFITISGLIYFLKIHVCGVVFFFNMRVKKCVTYLFLRPKERRGVLINVGLVHL